MVEINFRTVRGTGAICRGGCLCKIPKKRKALFLSVHGAGKGERIYICLKCSKKYMETFKDLIGQYENGDD